MSKDIQMGVEPSESAYGRFISAWHRAESGQMQPEIHLKFEDFAQFAAVLTPKRVELLRVLKSQGSLSIRALSIQLERDYKNVHTDVSRLVECGLIDVDEHGEYSAPFDVIDAQIRLVA